MTHARLVTHYAQQEIATAGRYDFELLGTEMSDAFRSLSRQ